jgi:mRNA interferase RelE/StbE
VYILKFHRKAARQLEKIPRKAAEKIAAEIRALTAEPYPDRSQLLVSTDNLRRIRIQDYRIIYTVFEAEGVIFIGKIARRSEDTYRDLKNIETAARQMIENLESDR